MERPPGCKALCKINQTTSPGIEGCSICGFLKGVSTTQFIIIPVSGIKGHDDTLDPLTFALSIRQTVSRIIRASVQNKSTKAPYAVLPGAVSLEDHKISIRDVRVVWADPLNGGQETVKLYGLSKEELHDQLEGICLREYRDRLVIDWTFDHGPDAQSEWV